MKETLLTDKKKDSTGKQKKKRWKKDSTNEQREFLRVTAQTKT